MKVTYDAIEASSDRPEISVVDLEVSENDRLLGTSGTASAALKSHFEIDSEDNDNEGDDMLLNSTIKGDILLAVYHARFLGPLLAFVFFLVGYQLALNPYPLNKNSGTSSMSMDSLVREKDLHNTLKHHSFISWYSNHQ